MGGKAGTAYGLSHLGDYEATLFSEHSQNLAYGVELPICESVYEILYEDKSPKNVLEKLFNRSLKNEC